MTQPQGSLVNGSICIRFAIDSSLEDEFFVPKAVVFWVRWRVESQVYVAVKRNTQLTKALPQLPTTRLPDRSKQEARPSRPGFPR